MTSRVQFTSLLRGLGIGGVVSTWNGTAGAGPVAPGTSSVGTSSIVDIEDVLRRAGAAGAPAAARDELRDLWPSLDARTRAQVGAPLRPADGSDVLRWGTAAARQTDGTTCGSAVLTMLAAAGDPLLALWLAVGSTCGGYRPPELQDVDLDTPPGQDPDAGAAARFGAVQESIKRRSNRGALLGCPWPAALGTPPWGAARVARFPGVGYRSVLVDDTRTSEVSAVVSRAARALDHGVPVPLYVGGDLGSGIAAAVPRHVVLLTGHDGDRVTVYEPSQGRVHDVAVEELVRSSGPSPALGGWSHVDWALLPARPADTVGA
ncbi:hypothetical protein [Cellulomonas sp. P24]|uniref:hypothetical protein n=1 Tax=Cellulomonas sp. P24 TaxID=2885206 RepID=UPI00216ACC6C|nr:hypothetical protein [Cellulomonas sp. P24]MCR6493885.1 hypothetical protein [Cellulomonas sp. P24]